MCGIFCSISKKGQHKCDNKHREILKRRGPDHHGIKEIQLDDYFLHFEAWVLHMRGDEIYRQPSTSEDRNILVWNGEIFGGIRVLDHECDTEVLLNKLDECTSQLDIANLMATIEGPWSIVYFQLSTKTLFFGRDYFGRRSLLCTIINDNFVISSTANRSCYNEIDFKWDEIPGCGVFSLSLDQLHPKNHFSNFKLYPWISVSDNTLKKEDLFAGGQHIFYTVESPLVTNMQQKINDIKIKRNEPCLLSNIENQDPLVTLKQYCDTTNLWPICKQFIFYLNNAVKKRTRTLESWGTNCNVGILFSGGIDCTMLALLAHKNLPENEPIDLLNVAFQRHRQQNLKLKHKKQITSDVEEYNVPDRITGLSTLLELRQLFPNRKWNFVEINITIEGLKLMREQTIANLTYPKATVLDDSIACALWFASRGTGFIRDENNKRTPYSSSCRILLCGMGADEQLGGYSRHRNIFNNKEMNWNGVEAELNMEVERISSRNLGRDDRVIADHSREALLPYLDENVVSFLMSLPVHYKTDLRLNRGVGEKILLRGAAYYLGLREAAVLPKRAIQFGSRIAKAESGKERGNDLCQRLDVAAKLS